MLRGCKKLDLARCFGLDDDALMAVADVPCLDSDTLLSLAELSYMAGDTPKSIHFIDRVGDQVF